MSVNRYKPHVLVLPEDDANRQLADWFHLQVDGTRLRQMQVLREASGWAQLLDRFLSDEIVGMVDYPHRFMVLLIDFDGRRERLNEAKERIPPHLSTRVFILGALTEPEGLKAALGSYEDIGRTLAKDCREGTNTTWGHELLQHNASELDRLREHVRPILF